MASTPFDIAQPVSPFSEFTPVQRNARLLKLLNRLGMSAGDLECTFDVCYETGRSWLVGKIKIPVAVLVALSAIETLDPAQREAFIVRKPRRELKENKKAVKQREYYARKAEERQQAEALAARPPLSACQARKAA
jgi:hypothetical protein